MGGCAEVCLDTGEDYCNEFHWTRTRRARKEHRCCECDGPIAPGQQYEYVSAKSDGAIFVEKTCLDCAAIRDALVCGSFLYGALWEAIEENVFPVWDYAGPWDCLAKIDSLSARQALQERYRAYKAEAD